MRNILRTLAILACSLAAGIAIAEPRDPLAYPLRQWLAVLGMTLLGGIGGWYLKVRRGEVLVTSLFALVGEMTISALAGGITFFVCDYLAVPIGATAACAGMAGYMGGRAIDMFETWGLKKAGFVPDRRTGTTRPAPLDEARP
jgi:hypothetical protein